MPCKVEGQRYNQYTYQYPIQREWHDLIVADGGITLGEFTEGEKIKYRRLNAAREGAFGNMFLYDSVPMIVVSVPTHHKTNQALQVLLEYLTDWTPRVGPALVCADITPRMSGKCVHISQTLYGKYEGTIADKEQVPGSTATGKGTTVAAKVKEKKKATPKKPESKAEAEGASEVKAEEEA
jgi:hypothetical protein